ncbi:MAG TPA: hypothetical protein VGR63_19020 [Casimicrobiaceae bacterium]|jgi:hypothetical protein|nr:hypothetical protein [Casimicrobiaceae bacterium]
MTATATASVLQAPAYNLDDPSTLTIDLNNPKPKEILAISKTFEEAMRANPDPGPLPVNTGWHDITPAIAVNLLRRNYRGANRSLDAATVVYYAIQMKEGEWRATGQPIILNVEGGLLDAQHRLYAGLVSGETFKSFVVTDVEARSDMFAFIDNSKARTGADALRTAGFNGVSPTIAKVLRFAEEIRVGLYSPTGATRLARITPAHLIRLVQTYPNVLAASRSAASDWADAVDYLDGRKEVVAYVGMRITDEHDDALADEFIEDILDGETARATDHPIAAFRKKMDDNNRAAKKMKRSVMTAYMIQAFNAWHLQQTLGRRWWWNPQNEAFPAIVGAGPAAQAAE